MNSRAIDILVLSGIQTWNLTVCLYSNLKHGELHHLATMADIVSIIYRVCILVSNLTHLLIPILNRIPRMKKASHSLGLIPM